MNRKELMKKDDDDDEDDEDEGCSHTYLVWSGLSDLPVWCVPCTKQLDLGLTERSDLGLDQSELWFGLLLVWRHYFERFGLLAQYRKSQQTTIRSSARKERKDNAPKCSLGEEESKCRIDVWSNNFINSQLEKTPLSLTHEKTDVHFMMNWTAFWRCSHRWWLQDIGMTSCLQFACIIAVQNQN